MAGRLPDPTATDRVSCVLVDPATTHGLHLGRRVFDRVALARGGRPAGFAWCLRGRRRDAHGGHRGAEGRFGQKHASRPVSAWSWPGAARGCSAWTRIRRARSRPWARVRRGWTADRPSWRIRSPRSTGPGVTSPSARPLSTWCSWTARRPLGDIQRKPLSWRPTMSSPAARRPRTCGRSTPRWAHPRVGAVAPPAPGPSSCLPGGNESLAPNSWPSRFSGWISPPPAPRGTNGEPMAEPASGTLPRRHFGSPGKGSPNRTPRTASAMRM